jgi:hypothetical protein
MRALRSASAAILFAVWLSTLPAAGQQPCPNGLQIEGSVTDPSGALVPGATVSAAGSQTTTDSAGRYVLPCVPSGPIDVTASAQGFAPAVQRAGRHAGGVVRVDLKLALLRVETNVQVSAEPSVMDPEGGSDSTSLNRAEVQRLPDDPDDLLQQLQALAAAAGGNPTLATISVDGFASPSAMPPKGSIASIRVNPDLFSAEYQWPPFSGGVIQIFTKPGADSYHGALFFTDSPSIFNANDPFSFASTPAGKQRYGFELSGPVAAQKNGFSLALEKRNIDEFDVVDATTLAADGGPAPLHQAVAAPQRLWIGSARDDWQLTPKDVAAISYSANVNQLGNQGAGGQTLVEAAYSSLVSEYDLRLSNTFTFSPNALIETRAGYSWKRTSETPNSSAPSLLVAGDFTGGGATSQDMNDRERDLELDTDALITRGKHAVKFGAQSLGNFVHDYDPDTFNGAFVFGGGIAPVLDAGNAPTGETTTISALEQYRRALAGLPGGAPTTYQLSAGTPLVPFTQWRLGLFLQDTVKLGPRLTMEVGLRYQLETTPGSYLNFDPRLGFAWAIDKKQTWVFHVRTGLFNNSNTDPSYITAVDRLNGSRQHETTIYAPGYRQPLVPAPGSIAIGTLDRFPSPLGLSNTSGVYVNLEHEFRGHWRARVNYYNGADWNVIRIRNINAPMVASSIGAAPDPSAALRAPRPIAPNENIFEYQNAGHLEDNLVAFNLDQHENKYFGFSFRYGHQVVKTDYDDGAGTDSPQSSYTDLGESARADWDRVNNFTLTGNLNLPRKLELDTQFNGGDGVPYDVTTGTDNNGDGDFNDRPSYAAAPGPGVYATKFGLLTTNTVNGNVPRNLGTMPGPIRLNLNMSRAFNLNPKDKDRPRTVTFNARSSNLLNHTNVTAVSSVVSSPTFSQPIAAEAARRVELGVRFSF